MKSKAIKKTLSCILALALAAGMYAAPVYAEDENAGATLLSEEKAGTTKSDSLSDFVIENNVLTEYKGTGGDVVIPDGVTNIGANVFANNAKIRTLTMPDSVTDMFLWYDSIDNIDYVNTVGNSPFQGCTNLTSVKLSKNLNYLSGGAFLGCTSLRSIEIPDSVTMIGGCAFQDSALENIKWGSGVTKLGWNAFNGTNLKSVEIPDTVTYIGAHCFRNCSSLESVVLPDSIEDSGFQIDAYGNFAFNSCTSLKSITFGKKMTTIPANFLSDCTSLMEITIPDNIIKLDACCFSGCTSLSKINFGKIQSYNTAFINCTAIKELMLPDTVTEIVSSGWGGAFQGMDGVEVFRIPSGFTDVTKVGLWYLNEVFPNLKKLYIDVNTECFGAEDFKQCKKLRDICYTGTKNDWNSKIVYKNPDIYLVTNMDNYIIHCSDGDIVGKYVPKITLSSISASLAEGYTITEGDDLDLSKIKITAVYSDRSTDDTLTGASEGVTVSNYSKTTAGKQTLTVSYNGKTTTLQINVKKKPVATLDGQPVEDLSKALKTLKSGDHVIELLCPVTVKTLIVPKNLANVTINSTVGAALRINSITANSPLVINCAVKATSAGKFIKVNAKSNFTASDSTFGNVTVKGKAFLTNVTVNGNLKLSAKADKTYAASDTLKNVTVTKKVTSNNSIVFENCPSIGAVSSKGSVTVTGTGTTKAISITAKASSGITSLANVTLTKKISVKSILDVNGSVTALGTVTAAGIGSENGAVLTTSGLSVSKSGLTSGTKAITLKITDKKGAAKSFKAGAVVVKKFKGSFDPALLTLGEQTLIQKSGKLYLA